MKNLLLSASLATLSLCLNVNASHAMNLADDLLPEITHLIKEKFVEVTYRGYKAPSGEKVEEALEEESINFNENGITFTMENTDVVIHKICLRELCPESTTPQTATSLMKFTYQDIYDVVRKEVVVYSPQEPAHSVIHAEVSGATKQQDGTYSNSDWYDNSNHDIKIFFPQSHEGDLEKYSKKFWLIDKKK